MPRPRSLTTTRIAAAALAVIDRDGLAGLSMRAVAAELSMGTMSLYRYVTDREQLEGLVCELILSSVDTTRPARASWARQITVLVERVRDAVRAHPEVVPLTMTHRHTTASLHGWSEAVLAALTEGGFSGLQRAIALRTLLKYLIGSIQLEHLGSLSGPGTAALAYLPPDEFPLLSQTARHVQPIPSDEEFRRGLSILLRGLHASQ